MMMTTMDDGSRGGCCIARYGGGGATSYDDYVDFSKMHRIMLRFRPIAPKPVATCPPGSSSGGSSPDLSDVTSKPSRGRKRIRNNTKGGGGGGDGVHNKRPCRRGRKRKVDSAGETPQPNIEEAATATAVGEGGGGGGLSSVTTTLLPLLPESPDGCMKHVPQTATATAPVTNSDGCRGQAGGNSTSNNNTRAVVFGSCVTLECVSTDTWVDSGGLGRTDDEKKLSLAMDTCPGLISDGSGRVTWTNEAYRKMVTGVDDGEEENEVREEEMAVWLMTKWKTPVTAATVGREGPFSCRVRVQYYVMTRGRRMDGEVTTKRSITVPCDVWGMEGGGGFAWRLDVNAALSLGR